jgi:hypothetical protein
MFERAILLLRGEIGKVKTLRCGMAILATTRCGRDAHAIF